MDKETGRWEHKVIENEGTPEELVHVIQGRVFSQLDTPTMMRRAGIPVQDKHGFYKLQTEYPDVIVEVLFERCIISHEIGYGPTCDFRPTDFSSDDMDTMALKIMRPFKAELVREALKIGEGHILDVMSEQEIAKAKDMGWFTPEEEAAIDADIFLAKKPKKPDSDPIKEAEPPTP